MFSVVIPVVILFLYAAVGVMIFFNIANDYSYAEVGVSYSEVWFALLCAVIWPIVYLLSTPLFLIRDVSITIQGLNASIKSFFQHTRIKK